MRNLLIAGALCFPVAFAGGCRFVEDPRYLKAQKRVEEDKKKVEQAQAEVAKTIAALEAAKTDDEKASLSRLLETAKGTLSGATMNLKESNAKLDEIAQERPQSTLGGILSFLSTLPGVIGLVGLGGSTALNVGLNIARKNYKGALRSTTRGIEEFAEKPEGKKIKKRIALELKGTGAAKAINKVLGEERLLAKSAEDGVVEKTSG